MNINKEFSPLGFRCLGSCGGHIPKECASAHSLGCLMGYHLRPFTVFDKKLTVLAQGHRPLTPTLKEMENSKISLPIICIFSKQCMLPSTQPFKPDTEEQASFLSAPSFQFIEAFQLYLQAGLELAVVPIPTARSESRVLSTCVTSAPQMGCPASILFHFQFILYTAPEPFLSNIKWDHVTLLMKSLQCLLIY